MRLLVSSLVLASTLGFFALGTSAEAPSAPVAPAGEWTIDPVHSTIHFKIKHNNASWFYGRLNDISGSFMFDEADPSSAGFAVEVKADSVDSGNEKLDQHLRSPDFFDVKQFPVISLESTSIEKAGKGYKVKGKLSLHGVTKDISFDLEHVGTGDSRGDKVIGFHTVFTIDRTDFGMDYGVGAIGSDVQLIVSIEAGQQ